MGLRKQGNGNGGFVSGGEGMVRGGEGKLEGMVFCFSLLSSAVQECS